MKTWKVIDSYYVFAPAESLNNEGQSTIAPIYDAISSHSRSQNLIKDTNLQHYKHRRVYGFLKARAFRMVAGWAWHMKCHNYHNCENRIQLWTRSVNHGRYSL